MELIAVIMHGETSDKRNADAKALLNYGFSAYELSPVEPAEPLPLLPVILGTADTVSVTVSAENSTLLTEKGRASGLTQHVELPENVTAPVVQGQQLGSLTVYDGDTALLRLPLLAGESVGKKTWGSIFTELLRRAMYLS